MGGEGSVWFARHHVPTLRKPLPKNALWKLMFDARWFFEESPSRTSIIVFWWQHWKIQIYARDLRAVNWNRNGSVLVWCLNSCLRYRVPSESWKPCHHQQMTFLLAITNYNQSAQAAHRKSKNNWEVASSLIFILITDNWWPTSCDDTANVINCELIMPSWNFFAPSFAPRATFQRFARSVNLKAETLSLLSSLCELMAIGISVGNFVVKFELLSRWLNWTWNEDGDVEEDEEGGGDVA